MFSCVQTTANSSAKQREDWERKTPVKSRVSRRTDGQTPSWGRGEWSVSLVTARSRRAVSALTPRPALNHCSISYNRLRWFQHITRLCVHSACQLWGCQGHSVYHEALWLMLYSCEDLSSFCCFIILSWTKILPCLRNNNFVVFIILFL